jgi:hypothetical protein
MLSKHDSAQKVTVLERTTLWNEARSNAEDTPERISFDLPHRDKRLNVTRSQGIQIQQHEVKNSEFWKENSFQTSERVSLVAERDNRLFCNGSCRNLLLIGAPSNRCIIM